MLILLSTITNDDTRLHPIPMTLSDKFLFSNSPVAIRDHLAMQLLYKFAATYALGRPVGLNVVLNRSVPRDLAEFTELCAKYNSLELYLWLSLRFPKYFIERDTCLEQKNYALDIIQKTLTSSKLVQQYSHSYAYRISREVLILNHHIFTIPLLLPFYRIVLEDYRRSNTVSKY